MEQEANLVNAVFAALIHRTGSPGFGRLER